MLRFQRRLIAGMSVGVAIVALAALGWTWARPREEPVEVDLRSPPASLHDSEAPPLRFAVAPVLSPERTIDVYYDLVQYLASRLDRPARLVQRKTYGEVNELLRHSAVQAGIICTGAYLHATADQILLDVIAVPVYPEGPVYHSLLLVRADSDVESMQDLRNRPIAFSDPLSLSGHYYPLSMLLEQGFDPHSFFSRMTFTYSHDGSIRALLDKIVDAAAVDSLVYDYEVLHNPSIREKLQIIHRSPPLGINPVVVPAGLDPSLKESLQQALLGMDDDENGEGARILRRAGILAFDTPSETLYDSVTELFTRVRRYLEKG